MIPPRTARLGLSAVVIALATLLTTACSGSAEADPEATVTAPTATAPAPETSATADPEPTATAEPTCETIIGQSVIDAFESVDWTSQAEPFYIGSLEVPEGLMCVWADFDGPAGDHGQMFGWAPITDADASQAQNELLSQGWLREESAEGVYITESPDTTIATDEEGYGMTYLFTAGAVTLADTKQGLLLIEWPKS